MNRPYQNCCFIVGIIVACLFMAAAADAHPPKDACCDKVVVEIPCPPVPCVHIHPCPCCRGVIVHEHHRHFPILRNRFGFHLRCKLIRDHHAQHCKGPGGHPIIEDGCDKPESPKQKPKPKPKKPKPAKT